MPSLPSLSLPSPPLPDEPPPSLPLTPPSSPTSPASRSLPSLSPPTTYTDFDLDFTPISTPYETSSDPPPADEPPETDELESLQGLSITDRWMAENPREMELAALESNLSTHRKALYASLQAPVTAAQVDLLAVLSSGKSFGAGRTAMERALRECVVDGETEVDVEELVEVSLYFYVPPVIRRKQKARTELLRQVLTLPRAPSRERGDRW